MSLWPKRLRRSITGMIFPRRLMTPSMRSGALGTVVISGTRTISRTAPIRTPYVSLPMRKPTTWSSFSIQRVSAALGTNQLGVLFLVRTAIGRPARAARFRGAALAGRRSRTIENEAIHAVEKIAREFEHLLG